MSLATADERSSGARLWAIAFVVAAIPLTGFWLYGLFDIDEGFYAAVASEMLRSGDWITPRYNGSPWFEKPILLYWIAAPSIWLFGEAVGPRLPSILATLALYLACAVWLSRWFGETIGRWTLLILGTCLIVAASGRMMLVDPLLVLCLSASILAFLDSALADPRARVLSGALLGLAVLAKGPMPVAVYLAVGAWTWFAEPDMRSRLRGYWGMASCGFLAVVASWYLPAFLANGEAFVEEFLIRQNVGRLLGGDAAHTVPWWLYLPYYALVLALLAIPWSWHLLRAWPKRDHAEADRFGPDQRFVRRALGRWFVVVFVLFTLSGSKLPHYILPALPPLAMLVATWIGSRAASRRASVVPALPAVLSVGFATALNLAFIWYYGASGQREAHAVADAVRDRPGTVFTYQISRRSADRGTGTLSVQETSLPSLAFYANRPVPDVEHVGGFRAVTDRAWIITRPGRLGSHDAFLLSRLGMALAPVPSSAWGRSYELYSIIRISGP